jgi:hypothetical protein
LPLASLFPVIVAEELGAKPALGDGMPARIIKNGGA